MNDLLLGFQVMGYGLAGVFSVILILYGVIKILGHLFPDED